MRLIMKTFLFAPATYNLAEVTRMIEIAKACKGRFNCVFMGYGGDYEHLIEDENYEYRKLEPRLTPEKIEHLYKVDKGEKEGQLFTAEELRERVKTETALYKELKPVAVLTGFCLSTFLSTKIEKTNIISVIQSTWTREYFKAGLGTWPDLLDFPVINWFPEKLLNSLGSKIFLPLTMIFVFPFNKVAKEYGLKKFSSFADLYEGDYTFLAEPDGFSEITSKELPEEYHFIGPLIGRIDTEISEEVLNMPKDKPIIYFAMGSSGTPEIIAQIIESFKDKPYRVIAPVKALVEKMNINVPDNVIVTGWLPAHKVNPMADLSLIHGGVGTVMTACLAGTPVVGVGMQPEQEANLESLVRKGFAIRIKKKRVNAKAVLEAIDKMLHDKEAQQKAKDFQKVIQQWEDISKVADIMDSIEPKQ